MVTKKPATRERELELSRGGVRKNSLLIISVAVAVAAVLILVLIGTVLANHRPIIASLEAGSETVSPLGSCQIACNASDPDGDGLGYNWSASGGEITGEGATVTWSAPDSAGSYNVTVTVSDGRGGEVTQQATITVRANRPPTITSLVPDEHWPTPLDSIQVTCGASDADGDQLAYEWSTTGGNITGTGPEVTWTAPEEIGTYQVTVVVTDGQGGKDTELINLSTAAGTPPIIEDLVVTAEHQYLKETSTGYKVGKTKEYDIECITSNTSAELPYQWSCTGGQISGEGSMITWTAPDVSGEVTITVVVTDVADNIASRSIILDVVPCSACLFG
ncbi:MAG: PKD domain-containing protein [Dehalococcoidia bacterium]|nr:PKD domain-containing protein [Dehalococcoidia bacterium]MDH4299184.1 PKD domain-containing protein [Dehalococcoidia bacterium]MDH4366817.1 PKD domain-containing protein [Dehalococcoidia bacterium]